MTFNRFDGMGLGLAFAGVILASFTLGDQMGPSEWFRPAQDQHSPARAEIQCDAFDVDVHPHDAQSNSDADEFAQHLAGQPICRMNAEGNEGAMPIELRCGETVVMVYAKAETLQAELDEAARLLPQFREGGQCSWSNE